MTASSTTSRKCSSPLVPKPDIPPREPELTIEGLRRKLNELKRANEAVNNQKIAWKNAVINRNYQMNDDKVGLVSVAGRVKAYIRATFGYRSPEVAFISKLQFRKI